ncbi:hypothetical protein VNO77_28298 [Canavalia gladiata]|uniref:Uncharacterized protein n=1 Tax=Canavalia gladiata TaxID=3824 RepID=A0AAN9KWL3_CANGL
MAWTGDHVEESQSEIFDGEALTTCRTSLLEVYISCFESIVVVASPRTTWCMCASNSDTRGLWGHTCYPITNNHLVLDIYEAMISFVRFNGDISFYQKMTFSELSIA